MLAETADSLAAAVDQSIPLQSKMCWVPGAILQESHTGPQDRKSTGSDPLAMKPFIFIDGVWGAALQ